MKASSEKVISSIEELLANKDHVVVAVSGFGGAGKTTLAENIKNRFPDSTWVQLDNFLINHGEGEGWAGGYDWQRFESVLKDVRAGKNLHYQWYDWHADSLSPRWIDEKLPKLIIVEGSRILQPQLMPYFDLSIWIDCDLKTATARGIARDKNNWKDKADQKGLQAHLDKWPNVWVPKEEEFFEKFQPDIAADYRVTN